eukprot:SAG22_NODE_1590_length_4048_cov_3.816156_3_plen_164_part_00
MKRAVLAVFGLAAVVFAFYSGGISTARPVLNTESDAATARQKIHESEKASTGAGSSATSYETNDISTLKAKIASVTKAFQRINPLDTETKQHVRNQLLGLKSQLGPMLETARKAMHTWPASAASSLPRILLATFSNSVNVQSLEPGGAARMPQRGPRRAVANP